VLNLRTLALAGLSAVGLTAGTARADRHHGHHDRCRPVVACPPAPCPAPVAGYRPVVACPPAPCPAPVVAYRPVCPPPVVAVPPPPCGPVAPVARPSLFRAEVGLGPIDIRIGGCR
jgi:hypothetical protein